MTVDSTDTMPVSTKIARALVWSQAVLLGVWSALIVNTLIQISQLSDAEIKEAFQQEISTSQYVYNVLQTGALIIITIGLGWCAWNFKSRRHVVRTITISIEVPLFLIAILQVATMNFVVMAGVLGIIVLVMLWRSESREWLDPVDTA